MIILRTFKKRFTKVNFREYIILRVYHILTYDKLRFSLKIYHTISYVVPLTFVTNCNKMTGSVYIVN